MSYVVQFRSELGTLGEYLLTASHRPVIQVYVYVFSSYLSYNRIILDFKKCRQHVFEGCLKLSEIIYYLAFWGSLYRILKNLIVYENVIHPTRDIESCSLDAEGIDCAR